MTVNGLDSILSKSSPKMMLMPSQVVSMQWLVKAFNCSLDDICQVVLHSFKSAAQKSMKDSWFGNDAFQLAIGDYYYDRVHTVNVKTQTDFFKSMDELYVWADLHAK